MRKITLRLGQLTAGVLIAGALAVLCIPYAASGLTYLHAPVAAAALYNFDASTVERYVPWMVPDSAFSDLAQLEPAPSQLMTIADSAVDRPSIAMHLYEEALSSSGPYPRAQWVEHYAAFASGIDATKGAAAYLLAANVLMHSDTSGANGEVFADIDRALALRDTPKVRWIEAELYITNNSEQAIATLERMSALHEMEAQADDTAGLVAWSSERVRDAQAFLQHAATLDHRFERDLHSFVQFTHASNDLRWAEDMQADKVSQALDEQDRARSENDDLYHRLRTFSCDIRQFRDWQDASDDTLQRSCRAAANPSGGGLLLLALLLLAPEAEIGEAIGAGGEGAAGSAILEGVAVADASAAVDAGAADGELIDRIRTKLANDGYAGPDETVHVRESIAWKNDFGARFAADLDKEQAAVDAGIDVWYTTRRMRIVHVFVGRERADQLVTMQMEALRNREILRVSRRTFQFQVRVGRITIPETSCEQQQRNSTDHRCKSDSDTN